MKVLAIIAFLVAASATVNAQGKSLADATEELRAVLGLQNWIGSWNVLRNADFEVCWFSNYLNDDYPYFWAKISADPVYNDLRNTMIAAGVPWDEFVEHELQPAVGTHAYIYTCDDHGDAGGAARLTSEIRGFWNQDLVAATVTRLRAESSEFNDLHVRINAQQAAIRELRCSSEIQSVKNTMLYFGVDFDFVYAVLEVIFGWSDVSAC